MQVLEQTVILSAGRRLIMSSPSSARDSRSYKVDDVRVLPRSHDFVISSNVDRPIARNVRTFPHVYGSTLPFIRIGLPQHPARIAGISMRPRACFQGGSNRAANI